MNACFDSENCMSSVLFSYHYEFVETSSPPQVTLLFYLYVETYVMDIVRDSDFDFMALGI